MKETLTESQETILLAFDKGRALAPPELLAWVVGDAAHIEPDFALTPGAMRSHCLGLCRKGYVAFDSKSLRFCATEKGRRYLDRLIG